MKRAAWLFLLGAGLAACGGSSSSGNPLVITISGSTFSPAALNVPQGGVVTVENMDTMNHSVTSETNLGDYAPGPVAGVSFDTGQFMGTKTFSISSTAPVGTKVYYFCSVHKGAMNAPSQPYITVVAAGSPGGGY